MFHTKTENSEGQQQNIYRQMFSAAVQHSQDVLLHTNVLKHQSCCSVRIIPGAFARHGFRAAPYSCWRIVAVKLIIHPQLLRVSVIGRAVLKPVEWRPENRRINRIVVACQRAATIPDGVWSGNQELVQLSLPLPSCLVIWSGFMRGCATQHMYN